jgi:ubiquinone/menaquinone biosynthesis C-methylase UbiE
MMAINMFWKLYRMNLDLNIRMASRLLKNNIGFIKYYKDLILAVIMESNMSENLKIIDLGCGSQNHINLGPEAYKIIGMDIDIKKLSVNPYSYKLVGDAHILPIKENSVTELLHFLGP